MHCLFIWLPASRLATSQSKQRLCLNYELRITNYKLQGGNSLSDENLFDQEDYLQARVEQCIWQKSTDACISRQRFLKILATMVGATAIGGLAKPALAHSQTAVKTKGSKILKPLPPGYIS